METNDYHAEPAEQSGRSDDPESRASPPIPEPDDQRQRYDELNDRFLRLAADFDNFRKRSAREREIYTLLANERFAVDILEVADNLERALKSDEAHLREGVVRINQLLEDIMARHGVTPIDALKKPFNPAEHEAIVHVAAPEDAGTVIDEVSRGYRMNDRVIRYAKVAVSKGNNQQKSEE
ncbi:MAG: nucleotide exchange factor GrpE [Methanoregula sp.]|jgi:molecular chaperone GrpE